MSLSPDPQTLLALSGTFTLAVPYLSAVLTQDHYPRWKNEAIAFGVSALAGLTAFVAAGGRLEGHDLPVLFATISSVFTLAKVYYNKLARASPAIAMIQYKTGGAQSGDPAPGVAPPPASDPLFEAATDSDPLKPVSGPPA